MKDRIPLYPGRVKLNPVPGQKNTYDMVRADDPTQEGTPLNKATLLKDDTAEALGLTSEDPTVNEALLEIFNTANSKARIVTGNYVGTGTSGKKNPCSLTFDFTPKIVLMHRTGTTAYSEYTHCIVFVWDVTTMFEVGNAGDRTNIVTYSGNTMSWYNTTGNLASAGQQLNGSGTKYWYTAIG